MVNVISQSFKTGNGTRQGSLLSPYLYARYIRPLLRSVHNTRIGCNVGGMFYNILAYADDIVLIAPSWSAMQQLIDVLHDGALYIDMLINVKKTRCMMFNPKDRHMTVSQKFENVMLNGNVLQFISSFKYLGHILSCNSRDDADISRETKNLYIRANVLFRRFHVCSQRVKAKLYKYFCLCLYGSACGKISLVL